jgi:hypothetical protein
MGRMRDLLERRRLEYAIPDGAFRQQAMGWRVLLWQLPLWEGNTYQGTSILMTEQTKSRKVDEAPRGVIVSAGLEALDYLRSNGSDVGHIVNFLQLGPWRLPIDSIEGKQHYLVITHGADLIGDEDLQKALNAGYLTCEWSTEHQCHGYMYQGDEPPLMLPPKRVSQNNY